jgi:hypothetical protein
MAAWTTPITWVNGAVTAATMNTEVRDHFNWLKNALDLITNSTAADTGTATQLRIVRTNGTDAALAVTISGNPEDTTRIRAGGGIQMGDGSAAPQVVMSFSGGVLNFDRMAVAGSLLKLYTKSGAINDTDIPGYFTGAGTGSIGVDTTNSRLYVRVGSTWKFVNLV